MSKFIFNSLFIDLNETVIDMKHEDHMKLVNKLYYFVHSYVEFTDFNYAKYAFKVVQTKTKIKGYNLKGDLLWTIKWKRHMKNS